MTEISDDQIDQYLHEIRSWPRRPTNYDATTEDIIRRYLRGEIVIGADGNIRSRDPQSKSMEVPRSLITATSADVEPQGSLDL